MKQSLPAQVIYVQSLKLSSGELASAATPKKWTYLAEL